MSKSKNIKEKHKKSNKPKTYKGKPLKHPKKRKAKLFWTLFITSICLFGSIGGILSLFADITVESDMPLTKGDLKSAPIMITNNSLVPIHDVTYICRARELVNENGGKIIAYNKGVSPRNFVIEKLGRNETTTTGLPFTFVAGKIVLADFDFVVIYKPFWLCPYTLKSSFRFASTQNDKGEIFLLKRAISEK
jgi:hypothetical protein